MSAARFRFILLILNINDQKITSRYWIELIDILMAITNINHILETTPDYISRVSLLPDIRLYTVGKLQSNGTAAHCIIIWAPLLTGNKIQGIRTLFDNAL